MTTHDNGQPANVDPDDDGYEGFPVACASMHEHDPVDCAPEPYDPTENGAG